MAPTKIGRYEVKGTIGQSIMSTVYLAYDPSSKRDVAVKVLSREPENMEDTLDRFNMEAAKKHSLDRFKKELETIASLEHPTIVPVYDVGQDNDGQPFFVMRYMAGGSLSMLIEEGKFSLQDTARLIERIALALDHAHQKNIVHRDIKPDNILFDQQDNPYISDFGVAKLMEVTNPTTQERRVVGTPGYMSPEQALGGRVDARSDVYALGVMIYQMLTGKSPKKFATNASMEVIKEHVNEPIPEILKDDPNMPEAVDTVIKTAMAKYRDDRYASALDLARALNQAAFGEDRLFNSSATILDRPGILASSRARTRWIIAIVVILIGLVATFLFGGQLPFLSPASTSTPSLIPFTPTSLPTETLIPPTAEATPTLESPTPTAIPIPGGADQIAILSGNRIYLMNIDGSGLIQVRTDNSAKSNLQWVPGNRLVYISRNCAYILDGKTKETQEVVCFNVNEPLEGFRVSPDGKLVAISIQKTLNIVPFNIEALHGITSRFSLLTMKDSCFYNQYSFRDILWSNDGNQLAAHVVDTELINSDQIFLLSIDIPNCANIGPTRIDKFPGLNFGFSNKDSTKRITSYDWDGDHMFLLNDAVRNDGFGDLYLYDSKAQQEKIINPIDSVCCYRDATWSPDRKFILFVFQRFDSGDVHLYYIPYAALQSGQPFTPIELPDRFLLQREKPEPVLRPVQ